MHVCGVVVIYVQVSLYYTAVLNTLNILFT